MSIRYYGASHVGLRRRDNQDSICFLENGEHALLAVVCDGIGGGQQEDVTTTGIQHMKESFLKMEKCSSDVQVKHWLQDTIQEANDLVLQIHPYYRTKGDGYHTGQYFEM